MHSRCPLSPTSREAHLRLCLWVAGGAIPGCGTAVFWGMSVPHILCPLVGVWFVCCFRLW